MQLGGSENDKLENEYDTVENQEKMEAFRSFKLYGYRCIWFMSTWRTDVLQMKVNTSHSLP